MSEPYLKGRGFPHCSLYSFMKASMSSPCLLYKRTDLQGCRTCQCKARLVETHLTLLMILAFSFALCPSTCSCHAMAVAIWAPHFSCIWQPLNLFLNRKAWVLQSAINARQFKIHIANTHELERHPPDYKSIVSSSPLCASKDVLQTLHDPLSWNHTSQADTFAQLIQTSPKPSIYICVGTFNGIQL